MAESKEITYPNALASNGKIVNVNDPEFQDRSLTFTCLGCGEPMSAVHRTTGQSHFRHINSNPNCNPQTYLHRLAKRKYKEWFDSGKPFTFLTKVKIFVSILIYAAIEPKVKKKIVCQMAGISLTSTQCLTPVRKK